MSDAHVQPLDSFSLFQEAHGAHAAGELGKALELYKASLDLSFMEPTTLRDYGACLLAVGRYEEALKYLGHSLSIVEHDPLTHHQCALAAGELARFQEQKRHYDRAIELAPNAALFLWNRSLWYLAQGDYEQGWRDYAWGRAGVNRRHRTIRNPVDLTGLKAMRPSQTLLVWAEQGMGDTIQFVRFVKHLREVLPSGVRVVLEVQFELLSLLKDFPYADHVTTFTDTGAIPYTDFEHLALMDIPGVLGITNEEDFDIGPYIKAERPASYDDRLHIGFAYAGNPGHPNDRKRSMPWETIQPLTQMESVCAHYWLSGECPDAGGTNHGVVTYGQTAGELAGLDLVVTVDTSLAHLAAAMGKKVILMLPFVADWRWNVGRSMTPWYKGVTICRQPRPGDWGPVIAQVAAHIEDFNK